MKYKSRSARRSRYFRNGASAIALVAAGAGVVPAFAQTDGPLEAIYVTAQRRTEDIKDVPISVSTLSGVEFDSLFASGDDILALANRVPGLYAESSNGRAAPRFYIRGLGNTDFDLAASQPVSVIVDDVVLENVTLKASPVYDIEQVEVLRGPQGTLFGRNTTAGIVKFTTVKPSFEPSSFVTASIGEHNSTNIQGALGGVVSQDIIAARLSFLRQSRDDWITNAFTGAKIGGFEETAARLQFLIKPNDALSILTNLHGRNLTGRSAIAFRANIVGPGNNDLNGNFERDTVYFDGGGNNAQGYEGWGASLNVSYDMNGVTLTSITAYETTDGSSRGDIDGGVVDFGGGLTVPPGLTGSAFSFPGFIPFPSDTQDSIDLEQITQEIRLASDTGGPLFWQVGGYYFTSEFDVTTEGFTFPPTTVVTHENDLWAIFGQVSYDLTEVLTVVGGVRYTDDSKDLTSPGVTPVSVDDGQVSWDASATFEASPATNFYARIASGFRGPSIQGRDIAFFAPPSTADSETVLSYEIGFKSDLSARARLNGAVFYYEVEDLQLSAVGGGANLIQLVNADKGTGLGFEFEGEFAVTDNFEVTAGVAYADTELKDDALRVGICAQCTVTDPTVLVGGTPRALVDGNPFPQAPEWTGNFTARYAVPYGDGEFYAFTDWTYQGETNFFLYESQEYNSDGNFEGGLRLGYVTADGRFEGAVFARNITDEENLKGGIDFNNLTGFVNEPRVIGVSFTARR